MKSRHRSRNATKCVSLAAAAYLLTLAMQTAAARAIETTRGAIYTASDFERLAAGVDLGLFGRSRVSVWAPAAEVWQS